MRLFLREGEAQKTFRSQGYFILREAISHELIDAFWEEVARQRETNPDLTFSHHAKPIKNSEIGETGLDSERLRIIDMDRHAPITVELTLHKQVAGFLKRLYGMAPTAIQTLTYIYSSQQGSHSDKHLVTPSVVGPFYDRESLAASWIACEDTSDANGALLIYPGSHLLEKKQLKRDFDGDYQAYRQYLEELCAENGIEAERFYARKGDVLFWDGDFVHAGGKILDPDHTRRSLVTHYARVPKDFPCRLDGVERVRHRHGWGYRIAEAPAA